MNSWLSSIILMPTTGAGLTFDCAHCHWVTCSDTCLAGHRDRYHCHNSRCKYHRPAQPQQAAQPEPAQDDNDAALDPAGPSGTAAAEALPAPTTARETINRPGYGRLLVRETIMREYYWEEREVAEPLPPLPDEVTSAEVGAQARMLAEYRQRARE